MKNKFSLLVSGAAAALALMACSSLEVSNPEEENFPTGWSVSEYMAANPDLRALQIMDQVAIMNTKSGAASDEADETAFAGIMDQIAVNYAGFTAATWDATDAAKLKYLKNFNVRGATNELELFATLELDTNALAMQYVAFGKREGRPYRLCNESDASLIVKGECQADDKSFFDAHLYCSRDGVAYCIDCAPADACAAAPSSSADDATTKPTSSSAAAPTDPESSAAEDPTPESSSAAEPETPAEP